MEELKLRAMRYKKDNSNTFEPIGKPIGFLTEYELRKVHHFAIYQKDSSGFHQIAAFFGDEDWENAVMFFSEKRKQIKKEKAKRATNK